MTGGRGAPSPTTDGPSRQGGRVDVFVSYHDADRSWVRGVLLPALDDAGISYLDEDSLPLGEPRYVATEAAIADADRVIAVLTAPYLDGRETSLVTLLTAEYGDATQTWPLIPIRRDDAALPPRLAMLVPLDMRIESDWDDGVERLCRDLGAIAIDERPVPRCPYPGMTAYTTDDAERFVGRSADVAHMIDRLRLGPVLTVIGPSGCGKSSLVFAGLIPQLDAASRGGRGWTSVVVRPGADVHAALASAVGVDRTAAPAELTSAIERRAQDTDLLVVIDQAEEIFTGAEHAGRRGHRDAHASQQRLASTLSLVSELEHVRTVLTIRADFYGHLMSSPLWPVLESTRFDVRPLQGEDLRDAIIEPAEAVGVYVEPGLVERLVADAAQEPGLLPFVQETMVMLWSRIHRRLLTLARYEALVVARPEDGGATRSGLHVAMALHASGAVDALDRPQAQTAQRVLIRLVQFGHGRANVRQRQSVDELVSAAASEREFEEVLEHLVQRRLVTVSGEADDRTRTVDLAHEALITGWPRFEEWLDERRGAELARRYFVDLAERWRAQGGSRLDDPSVVARAWGWARGQDADRGLGTADLAEAERWLDSPHAHEVGMDRPPITDLVEHSRAWHAARTRFWRWLTAVLAGLSLALGVAAGGAWWLARLADERAETVTALLLAAASERPPEELDLAVLLALEAVERNPTVENQGALRNALETSPQLLRFLPPRDVDVLAVAASRDGRWMASGGGDGLVHLWDLGAVSDEPVVLEGHDGDVLALAFSPDGRWLASASRDDTVLVRDVTEPDRPPVRLSAAEPSPLVGECRARENLGNARDVRAVAFSPDGRELAFAGHSGLVERYEVATWAVSTPLSGHVCDVTDVAYSPDGSMLASASRDDTVRLWDRATGTVEVLGDATPVRGDPGDIRAVAWHPDSDTIAYAGNDRLVRTLRLSTMAETQIGNHDERVFALAFGPGGDTLYSAAADRAIHVWEPANGPQAPGRSLAGHRGPVRDLAVLPDGGLISGAEDGYVEVWDPARDVRLGRSLADVDGRAVAVVGAGDVVVGGLDDGRLVAWDSATTSVIAESRAIADAAIEQVVALGDGRYAAATGDTVAVWDPTSGELVGWAADADDGTQASLRAIASVGDGQLAVTADDAGVLRWWDTVSGRQSATPVRLSECSVLAVAVHPDADLLLATCNEGGAFAVDLDERGPVAVRAVAGTGKDAATFSPSGQLVTGGADGVTGLWRPGELGGRPDLRVDAVGERVRDVEVDPTGRLAVSVMGNEVHLWDVRTGRQFGGPWDLRTGVLDASFVGDGSVLAVVASPATQLLIDVDLESWRTAACDLVRRDLVDREWAAVVGDGGPRVSCAR